MLLWNVSIDGYLGALIAQLTAELQPLVPEMQVVVVVDHNYSE